ncbi:hypothetical protein [Shimia sediminis]|uniref:hypothetical protein n=1 Tax=Shimia sediminis TaxID=2497945 RepID=UPI000F8CED55|nr:hypothetical protein [Shimia sediminis]
MKITQMAQIVSQMCRLENEKSGNIFVRELRNAKLIKSGGKGINAPDMGKEDLTSLLIALLGTDKPAKAVEMCEYLGSFQLPESSNWVVGSEKLPSDSNHTFRELMEALCDPQNKIPNSIIIEVTGTAHIKVENEDVLGDDGQSISYMYFSREEIKKGEELWRDIPLGDISSPAAKSAIRATIDSPLSLHGLVTSRRISSDTIELIKTFMFPEHYREKLHEILASMEEENYEE